MSDVTSMVTWESSRPGVASVDTSGLVVSASTGTTSIQISLSGVTTSTDVTVTPAIPKSLAISPEGATLKAGNHTLQYHATETLSDGSQIDATARASWSSSNLASASISSPGGLATSANTPGSVTIGATVDGLSNSTGLTIATASHFVYTGNPDDGTISEFELDPATGSLTLQATDPGDRGDPIRFPAVDPSGRFLYAAAGASLLTYSIGDHGVLTRIGPSTGTSGPTFQVVLNPAGTLLFAPTLGAGIQAIPIANDGTLGAGVQVFSSGDLLEQATVDPTGRFLYVDDNTTNQLLAFSIGVGGSLSQVPGSPYTLAVNVDTITCTPNGQFVYVAVPQQRAVFGYSIDQNTGALTLISGAPIPLVVNGAPFAPSSVAINNTSTIAFMGGGGGIVAEWSIDAATGNLTPFGNSVTPVPDVFNIVIDQNNRALYCTSDISNALGVVLIDPLTAALSVAPGSPHPTGLRPAGVVVSP